MKLTLYAICGLGAIIVNFGCTTASDRAVPNSGPSAPASRHVGEGALDVYEEEGNYFEDLSGEILPDDELARLLTFPNVLVTAHQALFTHEAIS